MIDRIGAGGGRVGNLRQPQVTFRPTHGTLSDFHITVGIQLVQQVLQSWLMECKRHQKLHLGVHAEDCIIQMVLAVMVIMMDFTSTALSTSWLFGIKVFQSGIFKTFMIPRKMDFTPQETIEAR